jgi:hypothetical protein
MKAQAEVISKGKSIRDFFKPISLREIVDFKDSDPDGYTEVAEACQKYYTK